MHYIIIRFGTHRIIVGMKSFWVNSEDVSQLSLVDVKSYTRSQDGTIDPPVVRCRIEIAVCNQENCCLVQISVITEITRCTDLNLVVARYRSYVVLRSQDVLIQRTTQQIVMIRRCQLLWMDRKIKTLIMTSTLLPIGKYCVLKVYWRDIDRLQRSDNLSQIAEQLVIQRASVAATSRFSCWIGNR